MAPATKAKIQSIKLGQFVTDIGSALFVSSPNPSQYDASKEEASILLSAEQWEVFKAQLDKAMEENNAYSVVPKDKMRYPIKEATDSDGNSTGDIIVKAKTGIQYPAKILDSKGKPVVTGPGFSIPNRSKIRLAVGAEVIATSLYRGCLLRLNAIKILSANPFGGSNPFSGYDEDEGDYESPTTNAMDSDETMDWVD